MRKNNGDEETHQQRRGIVEDLVEKLQRGELTSKEAKKEIGKRGLREQESWKWGVSTLIVWATYFLLCFPPKGLAAVRFPTIMIHISLVLLGIGTFLMVWVHYSHLRRGGLKESGETIIFYREGPFSLIRHPGGLGFTTWFILLPIILSPWVSFTILSVLGIALVVSFHYYMVCVEEKINTIKWGDEYRQYKMEVPRLNLLKGLWSSRKRKGEGQEQGEDG